MALRPQNFRAANFRQPGRTEGRSSATPTRRFLSGPQDLDPARGRLDQLRRSIDAAYGDLIARGRENQAFALRQAERRFLAAGASAGLNAFARTRALADLQNSMNAARRAVESKVVADQLRQQAQIASQLASLDQAEFAQNLQAEQLRQQAIAREEALGQRQREFDVSQEAQFRRDVEGARRFDISTGEQARQFDASLAARRPRPQRQNLRQFSQTTNQGSVPSRRSFTLGRRRQPSKAYLTAKANIIRTQQEKEEGLGSFTGSNIRRRAHPSDLARVRAV